MAVATAVLVLLLGTTAGSVAVVGRLRSRRCRLGLAGALVALAGTWLAVDGPLEGPVLWDLTPAHGITAADLLAIPALAVAALLVVRAPSRPRTWTSSGRRKAAADRRVR
jgi:hypothetical protein